jgi:hypothetical protein
LKELDIFYFSSSSLVNPFFRFFRVAFNLGNDNNFEIDEIQIELTDLIVASLRVMPELKLLATAWNLIVHALDNVESKRLTAPSSASKKIAEKQEEKILAIQARVLVRFLVCGVELEIGTKRTKENVLSPFLDPFLATENCTCLPDMECSATQAKKRRRVYLPQEAMTLDLLRSLPKLLQTYKGDAHALRSLTCLPRCFGTVLSMYRVPSFMQDLAF